MKTSPYFIKSKLLYYLAFFAFVVSCQTQTTPRPVADFEFKELDTPGRFQFTNKSEHAGRYQWTFGDGQASTDQDPIIQYTTNGVFAVQLIAKGSSASDDVTKSVSVKNIVASATPAPIADFDVAPVSGQPGKVQFTNKSKNATRYQWTFSDGQATTEVSPAITFKNNGLVTATLTARSGSETDVAQKSVEISGLTTTGTILFWTNSYNGDIDVSVDGAVKGVITKYQSSATPACGSDGYVTLTYPAGTYNFYAKAANGRTWSGVFTVANGECRTKLLAVQ